MTVPPDAAAAARAAAPAAWTDPLAIKGGLGGGGGGGGGAAAGPAGAAATFTEGVRKDMLASRMDGEDLAGHHAEILNDLGREIGVLIRRDLGGGTENHKTVRI